MPIPYSTTGTITANGQNVALDYRAEEPNIRRFNGAVGIQVTGTFSATMNLQVTRDGTNYAAIQVLDESTGMLNTSITAAGLYRAELAGVVALRMRSTAYTSGSATVTLIAVEG